MAVILIGQTGLHVLSPVGLVTNYANELALVHPLCMVGSFVIAVPSQMLESASRKIAILKVNVCFFRLSLAE